MKKLIITTALVSIIAIGSTAGFVSANDKDTSSQLSNKAIQISKESSLTMNDNDSLRNSSNDVKVIKFDDKGGIFDSEGNEVSKDDYFRLLGIRGFSIKAYGGVTEEELRERTLTAFNVDADGNTEQEIQKEIEEGRALIGLYREANKLGIDFDDNTAEQILSEIMELRKKGTFEIDDPYYTVEDYKDTLKLAEEKGIETNGKSLRQIENELVERKDVPILKVL
ncbi:hypothetical protein [Bacillus solimangrovi]|uniref:Uncharacterized protein n=1 Tax=Bacillus solimangrovi TaxID=1305675 RepID=A0A1E5LCM3_9BACI|nr:hypothetical protein [Bacillus solimangrovi]OEH91823.1 hypothetical protein BFG57_03540 [Bacillus solimangrovi]